MKLLYCPRCGDIVLMRLEPRTCFCGASGGHYLDDRSTVEQTEGSVSFALLNYEVNKALEVFAQSPEQWNPMFCFRAFVNPLCETDVKYVSAESATHDDEDPPTTSIKTPTAT